MNRNSVEIAIDGFLNPSFPKAFKSIDDKMGELKNSLTSMERSTRKMDAFKSLKTSARESGLAIQQYKNSIKNLEESIAAQQKAGEKVSREQRKGLRDLQNKLGRTTRDYDKNRGKLNSLRSELNQAGFDTNRLANEQEKLAQKLQKTGGAYTKLASSQKLSQTRDRLRGGVGQARSELGGAFAPVLASAAAIANPLRFEHEMARVYSLTGAKADQKAGLSGVVKQIAEDFATTSVNAAKTAGVYGQAGFKPEQVKGILPSTFNVAEATRSDSEGVANLMGNFKTAFGLDASNASEMSYLANLLTKGSNTSKASIESLTESSKYLLDKPANMKINASETMAYLATTGDFGLLDSMAGTSFGQLMERLAKKDVQEKLTNAGINPFKIDEKSGQKVLQKPHEIARQWANRFEGVDSNNEQLQALQAEIFQTQAWQFMGPLVGYF